MELLLWLWMLDSRWLWNLPYPQKPSKLWAIPFILSIASLLGFVIQTYQNNLFNDTNVTTSSSASANSQQNGQFGGNDNNNSDSLEQKITQMMIEQEIKTYIDLYGQLQVFNIVLIVCVYLKQRNMEQIKFMDEGLEIDENEFQVGHYWRRREALFSSIGKMTVSFNACLFAYALVLIYQILRYNVNLDQISLMQIAHAACEIGTYAYIIFMGIVQLFTKGLAFFLYKTCPKVLIKWKRKGERKHRMIKSKY
eukprot:403373985